MSSSSIDGVVIACMDYRFVSSVMRYASDVGLGEGTFDLVCIKGGAGNFEQLRSHLITSRDLHDPQSVHLLIHEDCGYEASEADFDEAVRIAKEIFGSEVPILTRFLNHSCTQ